MRKRQACSFRPALDPLEGRIVLSAASHVAADPVVSAAVLPVSKPSPPVVPRATIDGVMTKIDRAFVSYEGKDAAGVLDTIGGAAANAASWVASAILSPDTNSDDSDSGNVTGGQGDANALQDRLQTAIDRLPFGKSQGPAMFHQVFGLGGLTPSDASVFRGLFTSTVDREIALGVRDGAFVLRPGEPHHPAHNS